MQSKEIRFSVLVPVYNVEKYLDDCIQSVLRQTYSNYELILVDDGSTDNSGTICDYYAERHSCVKVLHKSNQGLIHTRRYAIDHATGNYFVMLDSDDLIEENTLEILVNTITKHNCDCVFFNRKLLRDGKTIRASYHIDEEYTKDKRIILRKALIESPYNGFVLKCGKSTLYKGVDYSPYYHIQKGEDLLQSLELLHNCKDAEFIDAELYIYRVRPESITNSQKQNNRLDIDFTVRKLALQYMKKENVLTNNDYDEYRDKCIRLLIEKLYEIGLLGISKKEKKKYFRTIRRDNYYSSFLKEGYSRNAIIDYKAIIFVLFKAGYDDFLILLITIYNFFRRKK